MVTLFPLEFVTQTLAPSKAAQDGPALVVYVPTTLPSEASSFVTVLLLALSNQMLVPSKTAFRGLLSTV